MYINETKPQTAIDYAKTKGVCLLRDDIKFLRDKLQNLKSEQRRVVLKRYIDIWHYVMVNCDRGIEKQNRGRKAANLYILEL